MDGFFEKFSVYDFFNLLMGGGVFLTGLHMLGYKPIHFLYYDFCLPKNDWIKLTLVLAVCYIIGLELQSAGSWIERNIFKCQESMTHSFLNQDSGVITHKTKLKIYQNKANRLFYEKGIVKDDPKKFNSDECEYFFAHCSYYIQVRGESKKTEKMRALKGSSLLLMTSFTLLTLLSAGTTISRNCDKNIFWAALSVVVFLPLILWDVHTFVSDRKKSRAMIRKNCICMYIGALILCTVLLSLVIEFSEIRTASSFFITPLFLLLAIASYFQMKRNILYWIRMVLGVYEACSDLEQITSKK